MATNKIIGYKNIFGFVLPDWVDEGTIRLVITFLLSSVTILFVLIFVIWPKMDDIATLKNTLKNNQASLDSLKNSKIGFDEINNKIPESTQNVVLSAIPQAYSPENAVFQLRKMGDEIPNLSIISYKLPSGVLYESSPISTTPSKKKEVDNEPVAFVSYPIKLTVMAPVESLLLFVKKVESSLPYGIVSDLGMQEVTKLSSSQTGKLIRMELEVKYFQALLKKVNIASIKPISDDDLALVNKISGFTKVATTNFDESISSPSIEINQNLFGF